VSGRKETPSVRAEGSQHQQSGITGRPPEVVTKASARSSAPRERRSSALHAV